MRHTHWLTIFVTGTVATGAAVAATPVLAQRANASDALGAATIETVVVTAERREENVQNVPVTISVVTAKDAAALGVTDTQSLSEIVSGLSFPQAGPAATPYVRGIGSNVIAQGDENSVAVYINGVLQLSPNSALFSLNNISRIEVLKGPQGTLFGRNADGGVINVVTLKPDQTTSATASIGYGNYATVEGQFYGTTGITDDLATDLSVYGKNQGQGWGHNFYNGKSVFKGYDYSVRNQWLWTPTEALEITLAGSYSQSLDDSLSQHQAPGTVGLDGVTTYRGMYNVDIDVPGYVRKKSWDVSLHASYDMGWAKLISITGYSDVRMSRPDDSDGTPVNFEGGPLIDTVDKGITQELQLQSAPDSPIKWIGGFYYLNATSGYTPPGFITITGSVIEPNSPLILKGIETTNSYAGFAQATATILPDTNLTLGGRYTSDTRRINGQTVLPTGALPVAHQAATFNDFTYRATLDHKFGDNILVYFTDSTGFKAGQFNLTAPGDPPVKPEKVRSYEGGIKTSLFDNRLQIDAAAYHYNYTNIQANVYGSGSAVVRLINAAKAHVNGFDLDLIAIPIRALRVHAGLSYMDGKYESFPGAPIYFPSPTGGATITVGDAAGKSMIKAPKLQWSLGGDYTIETGDGIVELSANYSYQNAFYWDFGNAFREPARNLLSAAIAWSPSDAYEMRLWGRNLLDEEYAAAGIASNFGFHQTPGAPRTYGITLTAHI